MIQRLLLQGILYVFLTLAHTFCCEHNDDEDDKQEIVEQSLTVAREGERSDYLLPLQLTSDWAIDVLSVCNPAKVYLWKPVQGVDGRKTSVFGHVAIGILYQSSCHYMSFYPKYDILAKSGQAMLPVHYPDDVRHRECHADTVFSISACTALQLQHASDKITVARSRWRNDMAKYHLMARNCVIMTKRVLSALGIECDIIIDPESLEDILTSHPRVKKLI